MRGVEAVWKRIEGIFEELGYPYLRQGSLASKDDYPPSFYTFWNESFSEEMFYDDENRAFQSYWGICSYTSDPKLMYTMLDAFILKAKRQGFIIETAQDVDSDRPDYYGRFVTIIYLGGKDNA